MQHHPGLPSHNLTRRIRATLIKDLPPQSHMTPLPLRISPIPRKSRLASLAKLLPPDHWQQVRRTVVRQAGGRCCICGHAAPLHCHEIWAFNETTRIQWLAGLQALCPDCHGVRHLLYAHPGERNRLLEHFRRVNHLSDREAEEQIRAACQFQAWLDQREWTLHFGEFNLRMPCLANEVQRRQFLGITKPLRANTYRTSPPTPGNENGFPVF